MYLIESLSDSTIYMAYYTVAHILQAGDMYCSEPGAAPGGIPAEHMTPEVWDYVFLGADLPQGCPIPEETLHRMRREFEYWYPFDLRVSGKDLIQNHLTFCLYSHTAVWAERKDLWPRGMRCNGHLLLNAEKMSKSTGNFKTLAQAVAEYSADAMRMALADAGDSMDDANFEHQTSNGAILRLTKELAWIEEVLAAADGMRDEAPTLFLDRAFDNEINIAVHAAHAAYSKCLFREALKVGYYDLLNARDTYRFACGPEGMNRRVVMRFIDTCARLLAPICPHTCEHIWANLLKKEGFIVNAGWPEAAPADLMLQQTAGYIEATIHSLRKAIAKAEAPPKAKKGAAPAAAPGRVTGVELVVPKQYGGWQAKILDLLSSMFDASAGGLPADVMGKVLAAANSDPELSGMGPKAIKAQIMPFAKQKADAAGLAGAGALSLTLPFDEAGLLQENAAYLQRSLKLDSVSICSVSYDEQQAAGDERITAAAPGAPAPLFEQQQPMQA